MLRIHVITNTLNGPLLARESSHCINSCNIFLFNKVWCDMTTNDGGYMLFGRTNSSITWTVPSSTIPVEPYGDPHWASHLGDAPILDFRIQMSSAEDLSKTLAHW